MKGAQEGSVGRRDAGEAGRETREGEGKERKEKPRWGITEGEK